MTLEEWVRKGEALLRTGPHPDRARRDAELLLRHLLKQERAALLARWNERLHENESGEYLNFLMRRFAGEPIQYITGEAAFYGLTFRVNRSVLIPRPETEHLVEKAIELGGALKRPRIVDVGAGSGAIAVALAHELPHAEITAIDVSTAALEIAKLNAGSNGVADRIRFLHGNLLDPVAAEIFDLVVSNPPYVALNEREGMDVEVREFEPGVALFAGCDGLDVYRRLIPQAAAALVTGGQIVLEIGHGQQQAIGDLFASNGFGQIQFVADLQGIPRVACAERAAAHA